MLALSVWKLSESTTNCTEKNLPLTDQCPLSNNLSCFNLIELGGLSVAEKLGGSRKSEVCVYARTRTHTCIHTYAHTRTHSDVYIHTQTRIHTCACTHVNLITWLQIEKKIKLQRSKAFEIEKQLESPPPPPPTPHTHYEAKQKTKSKQKLSKKRPRAHTCGCENTPRHTQT